MRGMALLALSRWILSSKLQHIEPKQQQKIFATKQQQQQKKQPHQEVNLMNMLTEITMLSLLFIAWQLSNATIRTVKIASIAFNFSFCAGACVCYCLVASFAICRMIVAIVVLCARYYLPQ